MRQHLPKYRQICTDIIDSIKSGELQPGMKTPSENRIMETYGVSNTTARKALQYIEMTGWAKRIKGKGTFVQKRPVVRSVNKILSFTKNMLEAGYAPSTRILSIRLLDEGYSAVIGGRRYSMPGPLFMIERLRFADDIPMLLETRYISSKLCPDIDKKDLTGSLYDIYWNEYGLELTEIYQMLSTVLIDRETNSYFHLPSPASALHIDGVTFCGKEIILEMENSVYRGDKYTFTVRATNSPL